MDILLTIVAVIVIGLIVGYIKYQFKIGRW